jgi:hypothetical protein
MKAVTYFFKTFYACGGLGEEGYIYKKNFWKKLPIPKPTIEQEQQIEKLLQNKYYQAIDRLVYELYGLTEEEIGFIENQ